MTGLKALCGIDKLGGDVTDPQSLNRYAYGLNNPATLNDPSGLQPDGGYCDPFDPEGCPPPSCGGYLDLTPCPPVYCGPLDPEACSPLCYYLGNCWGYGDGYGAGGAEDTSMPPPTAGPAGQPPLGGGGLGGWPNGDVYGPRGPLTLWDILGPDLGSGCEPFGFCGGANGLLSWVAQTAEVAVCGFWLRSQKEPRTSKSAVRATRLLEW